MAQKIDRLIIELNNLNSQTDNLDYQTDFPDILISSSASQTNAQ